MSKIEYQVLHLYKYNQIKIKYNHYQQITDLRQHRRSEKLNHV